MGIVKATLSITVFLEEDEVDRFNEADLDTIAYEIDEGDWIAGSPVRTTPEPVPAEKLREELLAIGNDGTFFGAEDEEDEIPAP